MKRIAILALAACAAAAAWTAWPPKVVAVRPAAAVPYAAPAVPPATAEPQPEGPAPWSETLGHPGDDLERVPLPPVDSSAPAWLSMAEARVHGDPRSPPVVHDAPAAEPPPTAAQLADPQAYRQFEQGRHARLLASFADAARDEVPRLRADVERGRSAGVPESELAKMEEKIRRIEAMREQAAREAGQ